MTEDDEITYNPCWFPTLEEFEKELDQARKGTHPDGEDEFTVKHELFFDNLHWRTQNSIITDHSGESIGEDIDAHMEEVSEKELWETSLNDCTTYLRESVCEKIPDAEVEKFMTKDELKQWKHLRSLKAVEDL